MKTFHPAAPLVASARVDSPLGPLLLAASDHGLAGLWFDDQRHHPGLLDAPAKANHRHVQSAMHWLDAYWKDARSLAKSASAMEVALAPRGTPFQLAVWRALLGIASDEATTYGAIAAQIRSPQASRAVGAAVGRNPLGIIVPCHRVLGKDGSLTGYAGGLDRKVWLLRHESTGSQARLFSEQA